MTIRRELLDELHKDYETPQDILGEGELLKDFTKEVIECCLETELDTHLGYPKHSRKGNATGNMRNGHSQKTLKGEQGHLNIEVTTTLWHPRADGCPRQLKRPKKEPVSDGSLQDVNANHQMTHFANVNVTRPMGANIKLTHSVFAKVKLTHLLAKYDHDPHWVSSSFLLLLFILLSAFVTRRWLCFARCLPVFHAIAATLDGDRLRMVEEAIKQSGSQHFVAQ